MGGALALAAAKAVKETSLDCELLFANRTAKKAEALAAEIHKLYGVDAAVSDDNRLLAKKADYIFLGVKPQMIQEMLHGISDILAERKKSNESFTLITMAAGLSIARIKELAGGDYQTIRIMPNTPVSIGEGMILYSADNTDKKSIDGFKALMSMAGRLSELPESLIDAGSAVSGCGPAFMYMFIEALADGGVQAGLPRAKAYELAAQMAAGSAKLILESGKHPGELKDAVCSPGGTTIEGVRVLEEGGLRGIVMDAVIAAYEKNKLFK